MIIILAAAITVNLAQTNIINNANEAVVKQDFKTLQDELTLYIANRYADEKTNFDITTLEADKTTTPSVYEILTSLEKTKYKDYVTIVDGEIVIADTMPEPQRTWALEALNSTRISENIPKQEDTTPPTIPTNLELISTLSSITAIASGSTDNSNGKIMYEYSIDNVVWQSSGMFENLQGEILYTIYARAIDESGNLSEVNSKNIIISLSATTIKSKASTYYGEKVNYTAPNGFSNWLLFHSDGKNIYLIAEEYITLDLLPETSNKNKPENAYDVYPLAVPFDNIINDYEGSSNITDDVIKKLNSEYTYTSKNNNMKAVAYMLDYSIWNTGFKSTNADYVIGGPTVKLLFASYNQKNGTNYQVRVPSSTGYQIRKSDSDEWYNWKSSMLNTSDALYVIKDYANKAYGMWLASPSYGGTDNLMNTYDNGDIGFYAYNGTYRGFRPIVCLNSGVRMELIDGVFNIK